MDDLTTFLDELASSAPVPGGGSAAALQVAMGAALVAMVCNLTVGRKRYAEVQDDIRAILELAERERTQASHLIVEDSEAYAAVSTAMALPRGTEPERAERTTAVQTALKAAVDPPARCMESALRVLELAARVVDIGNRNAVSDVGVAALAASAGYAGARLNVDINLAAISDAEWVGAARDRLIDHIQVATLEAQVLARVTDLIGGQAG